MSDISTVQLQKFREAEQSKAKSEIKQIQDEKNRVVKKELDAQEGLVGQLKKDHEKKADTLNMELEQKFIELRRKHEELFANEKSRLDKELDSMKSAHEDRVAEIKISHQNELSKIEESHNNTVYNARQKFMKEKMKWES